MGATIENAAGQAKWEVTIPKPPDRGRIQGPPTERVTVKRGDCGYKPIGRTPSRMIFTSVLNTSSTTTSPGAVAAPTPFGRFYLQELINSGGMADIWLATDARGKAYALRRMHDRLRYNFGARRRFFRGCEILSKIGDHDCIISYVEHGKASGHPYLLMEYVEAENLKELYSRHDPVLLENVAQILIDMSLALEHMHENGFMHLDFKPEN